MGDSVRSTQGQISLTDTPLEPSIFRTDRPHQRETLEMEKPCSAMLKLLAGATVVGRSWLSPETTLLELR